MVFNLTDMSCCMEMTVKKQILKTQEFFISNKFEFLSRYFSTVDIYFSFKETVIKPFLSISNYQTFSRTRRLGIYDLLIVL